MADTMTASDEQRNAFAVCLTDRPDFSIRIGAYEWHVHKEVLSKQSKFFEKACNGEFKESKEQIIELHDDCPWAVALMIQWFYRKPSQALPLFLECSTETMTKMMLQGHGDSTFETEKEKYTKRESWEIHASLYKLADKYVVEDLKVEARSLIVAELVKATSTRLTYQNIVECIGIELVTKDKKLFQPLLDVSWRRISSAKNMLALWCGFAGPEGDKQMKATIGQYIYSQTAKLQAEQKSILESIEEAQKTLVEAESRMTYHPNNNPAKEKMKEAAKMLLTIQTKYQISQWSA